MYIMCVCLFSALSRRVGVLQISIIIIVIQLLLALWEMSSSGGWLLSWQQGAYLLWLRTASAHIAMQRVTIFECSLGVY